MQRWQIFLFSILAFAIIGGVGYLGFQGRLPFTQPEPPVPVEVPPTVEVTLGEVRQTIINPGQLVNYNTVDLPAGINGLISEVSVRPGDVVKAGDVLVRFGNQVQLEADVARAELDLLNAQQVLDELYQNHDSQLANARLRLVEAQKSVDEASRNRIRMDYPRATDLTLENAETKYLLAKEAHKEALREYNRWADKPLKHPKRVLALQNYVAAKQNMDLALANWNWLSMPPTENDLAKAETEVAAAEAELELAGIAYGRLVGGVDPNQLTRAKVELNKAELELTLAEGKLDALEVAVPFDGVVLEVNIHAGQSVREGEYLVKVVDPKALEVEISVVEEDYPFIEIGQVVELFFDAAPDVQVIGKVDRVIPKRASSDRPLYRVYISLEEIPDKLVEGMTADAAVILAQRKDVLRLPRALVKASSDGTAMVSVWMGGYEEDRTINVGLRGDLFVEILSGLEEGEQVVGQ